MKGKFHYFVIAGVLLFCGEIAHSADFITQDYSLSDGNSPSIEQACVATFTEDFDKWFHEVEKHNPADASKITSDKISTIEVSVKNSPPTDTSMITFNVSPFKNISITKSVVSVGSVPTLSDLGSADPFLLPARKRAALLSANMLKFESGVETQDTKRIHSITYTAYRVQYGDFPLSAGDLALMPIRSLSKNQISLLRLNFAICNADVIMSDNPIYKTLGVDAYYVFEGRFYKAGSIVNGKRVEDIATEASTDLGVLQSLGFTPSGEK